MNVEKGVKSIFYNYLFVIPALIMLAIFWVYPVFKVVQLSMFQWDGILPTMKFVGLMQFKELLTDAHWWASMKQAGYVTFLALTLQNAVALLLALACDKDIKYGNIYRVIFYLPPVLSGIVIGLIWNWIYDGNYGLLNYALKSIGLENLCTTWLANPKTALSAVAVVHMWRGFGWGFIILLAGLQNIPRQLYEAAKIDGANSWQTFKNVTVPLMIPVFILVTILTILGTMQIFDLIISMTGGGPGYHTEVPITRILASMIGSSRFGYACAQGIVFGLVLLVISLVQIRVSKFMKQT